MIYEYDLEHMKLRTGDLICTSDGGGPGLKGQFWRLLGKMIPGDVDHIVIYTGPEGRCVEAGAKGRVITFNISGDKWDYNAMYGERGIVDRLYGIVRPLQGKGLSPAAESQARETIANYCLEQATKGKPYNLNFLDSATDAAFYCSQLAYKAYLTVGINLNTDVGISDIPGTKNIIFPQEIWSGFQNERPL
ncbi:hypothetical protein M1B72_15135 [Geomonas paludis]|uniref:Permuted papain-like amidase enzyme, YaeF/YiiX, C92 family n=1 Tax=Geomonas paludis TaxID=2740185 RepID=A0ABY4L9W7_9BACT|nr:hypothetical protein [Geomonas paludis]UPU34776.1 hypothetical protein M1B72_15135 [Geomonas paludis]